MRKAIITGITGQDGPYLSEFLLNRGYEVYGTHRRTTTNNFWRIRELDIHDHPNFHLVEFDLTDLSDSIRLLNEVKPDELYNLAAQSFVSASFKQPIVTAGITGIGTLNILEAIRIVDSSIRFYQASSSEMFGKVQDTSQTENSPFYPRSPYGVAKLFAHWSAVNYRESYGIFTCCGILFNHESPLRGKEFVTRKISDLVARIYLGEDCILNIGNMEAIRDWGYAREYVEGMFLMLQQDEPDNYILATNRACSVRQFIELSFKSVGMEIEWVGERELEMGVDKKSGKILVKIDPQYYRPCEVDYLLGNPAKANRELGWRAITSLDQLVQMMVEADIRRNRDGYSF